MKAVEIDGHVDVDYVTVFQGSIIGDAVTDDVVDGGADRLWKAAVV